jgi:hypothetical protein
VSALTAPTAVPLQQWVVVVVGGRAGATPLVGSPCCYTCTGRGPQHGGVVGAVAPTNGNSQRHNMCTPTRAWRTRAQPPNMLTQSKVAGRLVIPGGCQGQPLCVGSSLLCRRVPVWGVGLHPPTVGTSKEGPHRCSCISKEGCATWHSPCLVWLRAAVSDKDPPCWLQGLVCRAGVLQ